MGDVVGDLRVTSSGSHSSLGRSRGSRQGINPAPRSWPAGSTPRSVWLRSQSPIVGTWQKDALGVGANTGALPMARNRYAVAEGSRAYIEEPVTGEEFAWLRVQPRCRSSSAHLESMPPPSFAPDARGVRAGNVRASVREQRQGTRGPTRLPLAKRRRRTAQPADEGRSRRRAPGTSCPAGSA